MADHQYRDSANGYRVRRGKGGQFHYEHWDVWEAHNCDIPSGYVIHHKNGNKRDNRIENLQCMPDREHRLEHSCRSENIAHLKAVQKATPHEVQCDNCGIVIMSTHHQQRFCTRKCTLQFNNRLLSQRRLAARYAAKEIINRG